MAMPRYNLRNADTCFFCLFFFKSALPNLYTLFHIITIRHCVRHQNHRGPFARCLTGEAADSDLRLF